MIEEICIGKGKIFINTVTQGERVGVAFTITDVEHEINTGTIDDVLNDDGEFNPALIIWIDSKESGRVLQDVVNGALLMLNGWKIEG